MHKHWLRFGCFGLVFTLLFAWLNTGATQPAARWMDFYRLPKNTIDVLFLGNSHSFRTFQPRVVNEILALNTYSLGISSETIVTSYYELREVLKTQKPKLVILETYTLNLTEFPSPALVFAFTDAGSLNANKVAAAAHFIPLKDISTLFPLIHTRVDWNDPSAFAAKLTGRTFAGEGEIDPRLGYAPVYSIISAADYESALTTPALTPANPVDKNALYLQKFIDLCRKNDIQVMLVSAPYLRIPAEKLPFYTTFDLAPVVEQYQLPWLRLDREGLTQLHFSDSNHVSDFGALEVSIDTALEAAAVLNVPVDLQKLAFYQSQLFAGYTLVPNGAGYNFRLSPRDPAAPLEYKFTLTDSAREEQYFETEWQTESALNFSLPAAGDYWLQVNVRNPANSYTLFGEFPLTSEGAE